MPAGSQIRKQVPGRIFDLFRTGQERTRQEIAAGLGLSMPTTLQNVTALLEAGVLEECGAAESSGGRKARRLRLREGAGWVLGISVGVHQVEVAAAGLLGQVRHSRVLPLEFEDTPAWYDALRQAVTAFAAEYVPAPVLGAGVSFPGTFDSHRQISSHIFRLSRMGLERFERCIPYPAVFENDANCACRAERRSLRDSYFYLSLNETVGGAVMLDGRLLAGDTFQAGEAGHVILVPGGRACYCGKHGCADAYLSPKALAGEGETLGGFFARLQAGDPQARERWEEYLEYLAILLTNLRMLYNMDLIIGGEAGAYIGPYLPEINAKALLYDRFARDVDYLHPCTCREYACAAGAARLALDTFGSRVLCQEGTK